MDLPVLNGLQYRASLFAGMRTGGKFTCIAIRFEFAETELQIFFAHQIALFQGNGRKTGRVCHIAAVVQLQKFDFAGGVPPSAELLADLTGFQCG